MVVNNIKFSRNSSYLFIMNYLGLSSPESITPFSQYVFAVITLSLIALISFINICIYFFVIYNLNYLENRYPFLKTNKIAK